MPVRGTLEVRKTGRVPIAAARTLLYLLVAGDPVTPTPEELEKIGQEVEGAIRQFGGRFERFLVIVTKENSPKLYWKSNDGTWAVGAATRYLSSMDELDRIQDREQRGER